MEPWGRGKAPLIVVPGDRRLHSLSLGEKVNALLNPERGETGVSNDWCIKRKAYVLFLSKCMSTSFLCHACQLIGFCHALAKTESRGSIRRSKQIIFI